jgi:hypothetical protein
MMGCGRQWCTGCREELIHRDHRHGKESASALGQIVSREGPENVSVADLDLASLKWLSNGSTLLRLIEQKNPGHRLKPGQKAILRLLDRAVDHCKLCPQASELHIEQRSGVYILRGHVAAATHSVRRETRFNGAQVVERLSDGQTRPIESHEAFFHFLDPEDSRRRPDRRHRQAQIDGIDDSWWEEPLP